MLRNLSPKSSSTTYEMYSSNANPEKDLLISQLKAEIFEKEQNEKNFALLQSKYRNLQNDLQLLSEAKLHLEYELRSKNEAGSKAVGGMKSENENILNELNEKIAMNKKLYNENNNLFRSLESKNAEYVGLRDQIAEQEEIIARLSEGKNNAERKILTLTQTQNNHNSNKIELKQEIEKCTIHLDQIEKALKEKNDANIDLLKQIDAQRFENKNLLGKLNSRAENKSITLKQLELANGQIEKMEIDYNNLSQENSRNKNDLNAISNNLSKENAMRLQIEKTNEKLESMISERNEEIKKITNENDAMKLSLDKLQNDKTNISNELDRYRKHIAVLTQQNDILSKELECVLDRDMKLRMQVGRSEKLGLTIEQNRNVIENSLNMLKCYLDKGNCGKTYEMTQSSSTFAQSGKL